jgi:hypothetical protein
VVSTSELVIIEQEALKDQANFKDGAPDTPRPDDPWGLLTPPAHPQKILYSCDEGNEEGRDEEDDGETSYAGGGCESREEHGLRQ